MDHLAESDCASATVLLIDSVTTLGDEHHDAVVVAGSHGGMIAAFLAAEGGVRAAIFNDAGGGLDDAGVQGLWALEARGMAAAAVGHMTARIGDAKDAYARGKITRVNRNARELGVAEGQSCEIAAELLRRAARVSVSLEHAEARVPLCPEIDDRIWGLDSASLTDARDKGRLLVIGSHGGLLGGNPVRALKSDAGFAVFNDAGVGVDDAGVTRLPALQARGIAAATVANTSARIGDARSSWLTGVISYVNKRAQDAGIRPGQTTQEAVHIMRNTL